jgi:PAS domain S-box-containing protein
LGATHPDSLKSGTGFLVGGGDVGALMRVRDWRTSPLGEPTTWPQPLRTLVGVMLGSSQPMFVAWGPEKAMLYNDGYAAILGLQHPAALGARFEDVWSDILDVVGPIMARGYAGQSTEMEDIAYVMHRNGYPEETHFSFSYTPVRDDAGAVAGIFCVCTETTNRVLAEARLASEVTRQRRLFERAPGFVAIMSGPDHVFEFVNDAFARIVGPRDFIGRSIRAVFPDIEGQGIYELLDRVYSTGERFVADQMAVTFRPSADAQREEHVLDFIYEPMMDESGHVTGIFVQGYETTGQALAEAARRTSEKRLRQIADNLPVLIGYVDAERRYRFNNKAYLTWLGRPPEDLYGLHLRDAAGSEAYEIVKPYIEAALAGRRSVHEWWAPFKGRWRFVRSEYIPDHAEDGTVNGFHVLASDLTEYKRSEDALIQSEARLRLAIDAGRMAIWELNMLTEAIVGSQDLNELFGFPPDATPSLAEFRARYLPGEHERMQDALQAVLKKGERFIEVETGCIWPDGTVRWLLMRGELYLAEDGTPTKVVGVLLDITERKRAEDHQQLLIHELNHRVKNTLATVQSIASQTLRNAGSTAQAQRDLESRLLALSRTHDVLTRENWEGASLREIVAQAFEPFKSYGRERLHYRGPEVRLVPRTALALSMALHELATNAAKYGALSDTTGRLSLTWSVDRTHAPRLHLRWEEMDGPPVKPVARRGFGSRLIERTLAQDLDGDAKIDFAPTGVVCTVDAPLAA